MRGHLATTRSEYSLAIHVMDAEGNLVTQADYGLPTAPFDCVQVDIPLDGLSEGLYEIRAFVYHWQDGYRLALAENTPQPFIYPFKQIIDEDGDVITQPFRTSIRSCECLIHQLPVMDTYIDGYHVREYALVLQRSINAPDYIVIGEFTVK